MFHGQLTTYNNYEKEYYEQKIYMAAINPFRIFSL